MVALCLHWPKVCRSPLGNWSCRQPCWKRPKVSRTGLWNKLGFLITALAMILAVGVIMTRKSDSAMGLVGNCLQVRLVPLSKERDPFESQFERLPVDLNDCLQGHERIKNVASKETCVGEKLAFTPRIQMTSEVLPSSMSSIWISNRPSGTLTWKSKACKCLGVRRRN